MARRPRRGVLALLISVAMTACSQGAGDGTQFPTSSMPSVPTSTSEPATTTSLAVTTTSSSPQTTVTPRLRELDAEVGVPDGAGPFPAVVLVHGGGWVGGSPAIMRPLAEHLEGNGFLTVNTRYRLATLERGSFPEAVEDVACAVAYAATHPQSDGTVAVVGHSAGAHIGAIVALTGDAYVEDCAQPGPGLPDRFVGLAGPYDVTRLGLAALLFFGEGPTANPGAWEAGNPQTLTDGNPDLSSLIMYGELDGLVDDAFAIQFSVALEASESKALLELVERARHNDLYDPEVVGDLIATWLDR